MKNSHRILYILPPSFLYPMGAAYVASVLQKAGIGFDIYGFFYDNRAWFKKNTPDKSDTGNTDNGFPLDIPALRSQEFLFELIANKKYDIILTGGLVGFFRWFYQVLPQIKGYNPSCKIIMGGGITKDLFENIIFANLSVDYILKGEAETNLIKLLELLSQKNTGLCDLSSVPGLAWKDNSSKIRKNRVERFDLENTDILPNWEAFHINEYIKLSDTLFRFDMTFFPIMVGRGCPNVCAFCSPSIGRFTSSPVDRVISEMSHWVKKYHFDFFFLYSEVAFEDESYTQNFCQKYREAIDKPWVGQLRTDVKFSFETYCMMKDSGCLFINFGFESACDRILTVMNKRTTLNDHIRNIEQAKKAGLSIFGNFVFGHDTETAEEIRKTFDFANKHDLIASSSNGLAALIIYPGTAYYKKAEKKGLIDDPFKFLLSYSLKAGISTADIRQKGDATRLNMTALSNDDFYEVVCTENIKHRRLFSRHHQATNVERNFSLGQRAGFVFTGKCPICKTPVEFDLNTYHNPLNISKLCKKCFYMVFLDIYRFNDTKFYLEEIQRCLKETNRIVVYGSWIMDLIFSDALSIPYEKIIAWVDPDNPDISNYNYIYHLPQMPLEELKATSYDLIVSLKPRVLSTSKLIAGNGLNGQCRILHILPDQLNAIVAKNLSGKTIAVAGESDGAKSAIQLLETQTGLKNIHRHTDIWDIDNQHSSYDFVIFDQNEYGIDRLKFAQNTRYRTTEILHTEFLYDGGFFTGI